MEMKEREKVQMEQSESKPLRLKPLVADLPWSMISPDAGGPLCTCALCGDVIGAPDHDPRWDGHDEDCPSCGLCEIPVRLFKDEGRGGELRFHPKCFKQIIDWPETQDRSLEEVE